MNLYWVTTEDHGEDWFTVANSAREAATFHEDFEGYDIGDATAELVTEIPDGVKADPGWPSDDVLKACDATIVSHGPARVVKIGERTFSEGLMESIIRSASDDMAEALGKGRPNKTSRESKH